MYLLLRVITGIFLFLPLAGCVGSRCFEPVKGVVCRSYQRVLGQHTPQSHNFYCKKCNGNSLDADQRSTPAPRFNEAACSAPRGNCLHRPIVSNADTFNSIMFIPKTVSHVSDYRLKENIRRLPFAPAVDEQISLRSPKLMDVPTTIPSSAHPF
ncbi:hypothetical protein Pan241w_03710 [Gimesia alba]|uniref:Uncharacterized protein n=1 Tax=Gimesia alba TaxID=2527973 RepID=A0A517R8W6_9PLAN|nr:hypothetical protein Pan241w_03710 [Gimesia alba]